MYIFLFGTNHLILDILNDIFVKETCNKPFCKVEHTFIKVILFLVYVYFYNLGLLSLLEAGNEPEFQETDLKLRD